MSENMDELREAGLALVRALDAQVDAQNGQGHPGEPCDRTMPGADPVQMMWPDTDACVKCQAALYGVEDEIQQAAIRVKVALGEPLREYERHNFQELVR